ncbi:o-succinylbenzoate synthase [Chloroflexota bacterium]
MKITRIILHHLRMKLRSPFETSFGSIQSRDCILLEAFCDDQVGYGECAADRDPGFSYETAKTAWHILQDFLVPAVLYQEINNADGLQQQMSFVRGHPMAKAGLEMAFWDLLGKRRGVSIKQLLGGESNRVQVGVSIGIQESPPELIKTVENYLALGYTRVKIKIKPGRDIGDTSAVRQAYPSVRLQVDANSAYSLESAQSLLPLDELDLLMIEQPLSEDDLWDHSLLQKEFNTPICLDESIISPRHARQALELRACKVINIKSGRVGGLSQAATIHDICRAHNVPVWCGGMLETGVGRAANLALASLPGFTLPGDISATDRYYKEDITEQCFSLNPGSTITVPNGHGLGVNINRLALERVTINRLTID